MNFETGWRRTRSINLAAALFTCGVEVLPARTLNERSGHTETEFHLLKDGHLPASTVPEDDPHQVALRFNMHDRARGEAWHIPVGPVRLGLESGDMETSDPCHPALDVLRVLEAGECLQTFMNRGTRYRIQVHAGAPRARYVEGQEPMASRIGTPGFETWHTADLAIAAAMARIGCPVLRIEGVKPHRRFVLPRFGHQLPGRMGPEDALGIYQAMQIQHDPENPVFGGELARQCPESPVVWGYAGRKARLILLRAIESPDSPCRQVFMHLHRSGQWQRKKRSALVEERADNQVLDQALKHLRA